MSAMTKSQDSALMQQWIKLFRSACPRLGILVVGVTGAGKSTLINILLGKEVAKVGESVHSETSTVNSYDGTIKNVKVRIYDTPGLGDSREDHADSAYLAKIKDVLKKGEIHVVIYCFKMDDTRLRRGLIRTFQQYNEIGISWEKTLIALTFANALSVPSKKKKEPGFSMMRFFNGRLEEWCKAIPEVLAREVKVEERFLAQIKIAPTADDRELELPDGGNWFNSLFLQMLELLPPYAMVRFLDIHSSNVVLNSDQKSPAGVELPHPPATDLASTPPETPAPVEPDHGPKIVFNEKDSERFQETVGKKVSEGINRWSVVKKVGVVAAGATAAAIAAPVVAAGAVLALPVAAVGAAVIGAFKWLRRKK